MILYVYTPLARYTTALYRSRRVTTDTSPRAQTQTAAVAVSYTTPFGFFPSPPSAFPLCPPCTNAALRWGGGRDGATTTTGSTARAFFRHRHRRSLLGLAPRTRVDGANPGAAAAHHAVDRRGLRIRRTFRTHRLYLLPVIGCERTASPPWTPQWSRRDPVTGKYL